MRSPLLGFVFAALGLLAVASGRADEGKVVISDKFRPTTAAREAGKPLNGTETEVGSAKWTASEPVVIGHNGATTLGQSNETASFPFSPSAFGLDRKPFALRFQIRFAKASNVLWFGFGKGKRFSCYVVLNVKDQTWKMNTGENEDPRTGQCFVNADVNNFELRVDPTSSTCDFVLNGDKVAEKVPMFIDASLFTSVNFRFFFLSRFEMSEVEIVAL